jgi:hypothetical protein
MTVLSPALYWTYVHAYMALRARRSRTLRLEHAHTHPPRRK